MGAGYRYIDVAMNEKIANLSAYHSLYYSQMKFGKMKGKEDSEYFGYGLYGQEISLRPLVKVHPETGVMALTIGRHAYGIPRLADEESEELLQDLVDFICQEPRIYRHAWKPGDLVVWDNRCLMHRGYPWDMTEHRVIYHARIVGDPQTEFATHI